jgi:hypothetical protein
MKMEHIERSEYAMNYMTAIHTRRAGRAPTWLDVAAAYDAGLTHAVAVTPAKRQALIRYLRALRVINATRSGALK